MMKDGDYQLAFDHYKALLVTEPNNTLYNYKAGVCILDSDIDIKGKAIRYLEKIKDAEDAPKDVLLQLGRAYHQAYKFQKAIIVLHEYIDQNLRDEYAQEAACRYIEMCTVAIDMIQHPLAVKIENMGEYVNSEDPDYYAFVVEDESFLLYTTRRTKGNAGYEMVDGYESAEIFIIKDKRGKWGKAKTIGGMVGSTFDEDIVGMSNDGTVIFIYLNTWEISGDLTITTKKGRQFQRPKLLGPGVNSIYEETTATISNDKQTIYFSSDRPGGYGGFDLYYSKRLPTGDFGEATNMGPNFNGPYDELFPDFSSNEKRFYFCSDGYQTMGDFDIFYCDFDEITKSWQKPKNIGYPINTPDNDYQISFSENGRTGYISALRKEGFGHIDIYRATFLDVEERQSVVVGNLYAMATIDYNNYITFRYYEKDGVKKRFTTDYIPDNSWTFLSEKQKIIKPGIQHKVMLTFEKDGVSKKYPLSKAPKNDPSYTFTNISILEIPIKGYKPPSGSRPKQTTVPIKSAYIEVKQVNSEILVGNYTPNKKTGRYVAIMHPGRYEILIEAKGYKPYKQIINVLGKSSFKEIISKDFELEPTEPLPPVPYTELPQKK
ncbi:MAG: PD40 domain-containing protein [Flavobacteriales bacterium]|nr:PD40 domain-containing protein [Flavobacteriales bacterium]